MDDIKSCVAAAGFECPGFNLVLSRREIGGVDQWNMLFDTRVLSNGPHTIAASANAGGRQSYIQSSMFNVQN